LAEGTLVADDSYYYFKIADNIAHGLGSSFDGISPTNGYHPLWLAVLIPVFGFVNQSIWIPVRLALTLSVCFDLISGLVIIQMLRSAGLNKEAQIASLFWFLSPFTLFVGLRGTEASLSTMLFLILFQRVMRFVRGEIPMNWTSAVLTGILVGMTGLARTDNLITIGLPLSLCCFFRSSDRTPETRKFVGWLAITGVSAMAVMSPWFIWNLSNFGSILQVSGQVKLYSHAIYGSLPTDWSSISGVVKSLLYPAAAPVIWPTRWLLGEEFQPPRLSIIVTFLLACGVLIPLVFARRSIISHLRATNSTFLIACPLVLMSIQTLVLGFVFRSYGTWYALPYIACLCPIVGVSLPPFLADPAVPRWLRQPFPIVTAALFATVLALGIYRFPWQPDRLEKGWGSEIDAVALRYPQGAVVGAFNAGVISWVASPHKNIKVTNLDCLVNNVAFAAVKRSAYLEYIINTVDVMAENPRGAAIYLTDNGVDSLQTVFRKWEGHSLWVREQ
jgi:hypothetical protein